MTLERYWSILLKQWKLILACLLLVGLGAYIGSKLMTPIYESSVLVEVDIRSGNNQADYSSLLASDQLVQTESELTTSDPVLREVASHYKWLTAEQLAREVASSVKVNTQIFEIDVQDPSPTQAAALANDVAATLIKQQLQISQQDDNRSQQQIQQDLDSTQQQIAGLTGQLTSLQAQSGKQSQIAILEAQLSGLQQHYNQWQTLLAQLELAEAQSGDFLRVVQPAQPNTSPVQPKTTLNTVAGLTAGLLVGMLLAMLFEQFDRRVRTSEALTSLLEWPIVGTIWSADKLEDPVNLSGHSLNVESYRILRTNIGFSVIDKPLRSMVVTSAVPHEGKSTIAANLAIFMARAGKHTLLIDADLRRPTLHEKFHLPIDKMGLSNAVVASSQQRQFVNTLSPKGQSMTLLARNFSLDPYMHSVGIPNLLVMPSGPLPPNPPELLDSKAMEHLFVLIEKSAAEVVIIDTPPLLGLADASILVPKVDGTIVVVDITRANKMHLKQLKTILTKTGSHVLGCVVNKQRRSRKDTEYSYYYYYRSVEQNREQVPAKNGHAPAVPLNSLPPVHEPAAQLEHRMRSN